jgi:pyruvate, water dikinase
VIWRAFFSLGSIFGTLVVNKETGGITERRIGHKTFKLVRGDKGVDSPVKLDKTEADAPVLTDDEIARLVQMVRRNEEHYEQPQDIEWAIEGQEVLIVQSRPITVVAAGRAAEAKTPDKAPRGDGQFTQPRGRELVKGLGASAGIAVGAAHVLHSADQSGGFKKGEVLVAPMTAPDWMSLMQKASANSHRARRGDLACGNRVARDGLALRCRRG